MKCPNCNVNLLMTHRESVEIDYCPECRGVWLDRGELDKLIQYSVAAPSHNGVNVRGVKGYAIENEYKHRKSKRDSFFGDLFDF